VEQGEFDDGGTSRNASVTVGGLADGNNEQGDVNTRALNGMSAPDESAGLFDGYEPGAMSAPEESGGLFDGYEPELPEGEGDEGIEVLENYEPGEVNDHHGELLDDYDHGEVLDEGGDVLLEDFEPVATEDVDPDAIAAEDVEVEEAEAADKKGTGAKGSANKNQRKVEDKPTSVGGLLRSMGAGMRDYIAAEAVGTASTGLIGNDGDFFAAAEQHMLGGADDSADVVDDSADVVDDSADVEDDSAANAVSDNAAILGNLATGDDVDDMAGNLEDTMDTAEEAKDKQVGATTANGRSSMPAPSNQIDLDEAVEIYAAESAAKDSPTAPGGIFGLGASFFASLKTEAMDYVAGNILGDDLGALVVERMEEGGDDDEDDGGKPNAPATPSSIKGPSSRSTTTFEV
jgi:hypothetical protein